MHIVIAILQIVGQGKIKHKDAFDFQKPLTKNSTEISSLFMIS